MSIRTLVSVCTEASLSMAAQVRDNQYENHDRLPSEVQQEYRQSQATQSAEAASRQAFSARMTGQGHTIGP